jgi:hypothetical protein
MSQPVAGWFTLWQQTSGATHVSPLQSTDDVPEPLELDATVDEDVVGPLAVVDDVVDPIELVVPVVLPGPDEVVADAPPAPPFPS